MQIQPVVIGTAGHIDHGKSSLVRALTGTDPDRLKEERERGLTIDLGFARFQLSDGRTVGIVDVPGHERFIRNMVAGASGIDVVLLVVAADDGVMPQTREHLDIMGLLGMQRGLIALNKVDLVDEELVELAAEDVRETVRGTFLEGAPMLRVSATSGEGVDALRAALAEIADATAPRSAEGVFRMPVQRVFSARGFGTILTGIPVSGEVTPGTVLEVVPPALKGKVRGLQAYGEPAERARAGHSTAINLADVDHHAVHRGHVVATPGYFSAVSMVGARLTALPSLAQAIENRMSIRLHTGTAEVLGEVVLLDAERIEPGAECLVQLRLAEPVVCAPGDRFVLRLASPTITLGGGTILEESRHRLKRFKGFVIEELERQESSLESPRELLEVLLVREGEALPTARELAARFKRSPEETESLLGALEASGRAARMGNAGRWIHVDRLESALDKLAQLASVWFSEHPHRRVVEGLELRRLSGFDATLFAGVLEEAGRRGILELESGGRVAQVGRAQELDAQTEALCARVLESLVQAGFQPPQVEDLPSSAGTSAAELETALEVLVDRGQATRIGKSLVFAQARLDEASEAIVDNCTRNGQLEIPELRDRLGTSRKWLIPLLEHFDVQGLTSRQGGHRVLKRR